MLRLLNTTLCRRAAWFPDQHGTPLQVHVMHHPPVYIREVVVGIAE